MKTKRFTALILVVATFFVLLICAITNSRNTPQPGSIHHYSTIPYSQQHHVSSSSFITVAVAQNKALAVGKGIGKVVSADLITVSQASIDLGIPAAPDNYGEDRQIWLVLVHGNYIPSFSNSMSKPSTYNHYFVVIDATTGQIISTGSPIKQS